MIATAVPWPGQLDRDAAGDQDRRQPDGPESQVSSRWPHSERIACPITNEAAQMTARDA